MPSEQPNENMDKVLKAYARKRREDSPQMEMDLATRNMLQAEVKRTLAEAPVPAATRPRPRFAWWPQLIIGVASAAALAIAVLVWKLPSRTETTDSVAVSQPEPAGPASAEGGVVTFAAKEKSAANELDKDATPTVASDVPKASAPPSEVTQQIPHPQSDAEKKQEATGTIVYKNSITTAPATTPITTDSLAATAPTSTAAPTPTPAPQPATATPPATALSDATPAAVPQLATRSIAKTDASNLDRQANVAPQQQRIEFSQINNRTQYRINLNSPPLPKVLTKFGLERTGTNLVIKDADGSIYAGKAFQNSVAQNHAKSFVISGNANSANSPALNTGDAIPDDNFAFRVSGYNKKLRQKIIFNGTVINAAQNTNASNALVLPEQRDAAQNQNSSLQQQLPTQNILLNGRVQVGRNSEFNIEAAPITR